MASLNGPHKTASDLKPGDVLLDKDGEVVYRLVRPVTPDAPGDVAWIVRFEVDSGTGKRVWRQDQQVPHVTP